MPLPNFPSNPYIGQIVSGNGQQYQWNGTQWVLLISPPSPPTVYVSASAPPNPTQGILWYKTTNQTLYIYITALGGDYWEEISGEEVIEAGAPVTISASPPPNPQNGDLWFDLTNAIFSLWYESEGGGQWIAPMQGPPGGGSGGSFLVSDRLSYDAISKVLGVEDGFSIPSDANQTKWTTAWEERKQWDGGSLGLNPATGRTSLQLGTAAQSAVGDFATAAQFSNLNARLDSFRDASTIFVSKTGNDSNNGTSNGEKLLTLSAAVTAANAYVTANPGSKVKIDLAPGEYVETNLPFRLKPNILVQGSLQRGTIIKPATGQELNGFFALDSGCMICDLRFSGHQATGTSSTDSTVGIRAWAVRLNEQANGGQGVILTASPYIKDCASITAEDDAGLGGSTSTGDTGGGVLVDGAAVHPTSPLRSILCYGFTQQNLGGPGCVVRNDAYAELVSFFGLFGTWHVQCETGGQATLSGGGCSEFGIYGLVADGFSSSALFTGSLRIAGVAGSTTVDIISLSSNRLGSSSRPAAGQIMLLSGTAYVIQSSSPINSSGQVVSDSDPTRAGYRATFYNPNGVGLASNVPQGASVNFRQRSQISAGCHSANYVGSGTNYDALPGNGGVPNRSNEAVERNLGRVFGLIVNDVGDVKIAGGAFSVDGTTGSVTINTDQFNLSGLNAIGPFSRNGGVSTVGVQLQEVSNNATLLASTGTSDGNTAPTQFAVRTYADNKFLAGLTSIAGQPITISDTSVQDVNGFWTRSRNLSLSLNVANGLAQLNGSGILPTSLFPTTTVSVGSYGSASNVGTFTVDSQGRLTAASNVSISISSSAVSGLATVATSGAYADLSGRPNLALKADLVGGLVPSSQLPSYVDDVLEFANLAAFPVTGETGKIYVALDSNKAYRWSGSTYVEISASPGSTDAVPEGSVNLYFTQTRARQSISASGSLSYNSVTGVISYTTPTFVSSVSGTAPIVSSGGTTPVISISAATTTAAGSMSAADKLKLDGVATGATANSSDSFLLSRSNHTGTQSASTITGLATVATTGAYTDLSGRPSLATVATSGSYNDLSNRPTLGTAAATDSTAYATSAQGTKADTAVQPSTLATALSTKADLVGGLVPSSQLPSYVDDVLEFANVATFPATGETGKIYIAINTNKTYRWSGSTYVEISASPGSTDAVPEGSINLYFTNARASAAAPVQTVAGRTGSITLTVSDVSGAVNTTDSRLTDSREWSAPTVTQLEAETGTSTTRLAFTPQRVFQAIAAWWAASSAKTKLDGIATGATANSSDSFLLSRANHTGTQSASTITGLATVATSGSYADLSGRPSLATVATSGSYTDLTNLPTLGSAAATSSTDYVSAITVRSANLVLAGPSTGVAAVPTFRALVAADLPSTTVTPGSYGSASSVGTFAVDSQGRLTAASNVSISISSSAVSGLATVATSGAYGDLSGKPDLTLKADLVGGLVPSSQLPSYVDDVLEFSSLATFPATGETGKIYVALNNNKIYRWSGSTYVEISASPGSTDSVPEGSVNLYFTQARSRQSISVSGSLSYDSVTGVISYTAPTLATVATSGSYNDLSNRPTLGTAAALNVGTSANNVVQLDSSGRLPAVDGSLLTNLAGGTVTSVSGTAPIVSSGGTTPTISINAATTTAAGAMSAADKLKLDGVATGATANSSDSFLLSRANHTGTQSASTITGLATVATTGAYTDLSGRPSLATVATSGSYTDLTNLPTLGTAAATSSTDYISAITARSANLVLAGPASGAAAAPTFRALVAADLPSTAVSAGSYGSASSVGTFTVDSQGRLIAASNVSISISNTAVSGLGTFATANAATPPAIGGTTPSTAAFTNVTFPSQGSAPGTPASGFTLYANSSNAFSWRGANGFLRVLDGTANTADRTYTLPNVSGTLGLVPGSDTQVTFNDGGSLGGSANFTYTKATSLLTNKGNLLLDDGGTFTTTLQCATPTANRIITLPDATGTVALTTNIPAISTTPAQNLAATAAAGSSGQVADAGHVHQFQPTDLVIPLSGESAAITISTLLTIPYWPRPHVFTAVPVWMINGAPTGAAMQLDIRVGGASIFSTLPTIAAGATNSTTATPAVFSTAFVSGGQTVALGSSVTFVCTQVGTGGGTGLKVAIAARRAG